jgi:hypothetical protein
LCRLSDLGAERRIAVGLWWALLTLAPLHSLCGLCCGGAQELQRLNLVPADRYVVELWGQGLKMPPNARWPVYVMNSVKYDTLLSIHPQHH